MHDTRKPIPTKIRPSPQKISIIRCAAAPQKQNQPAATPISLQTFEDYGIDKQRDRYRK